MGRDVYEVEADCITAANRAFKRSIAGAAEILREAYTAWVDPHADKERVRHRGVRVPLSRSSRRTGLPVRLSTA